MLDTPADVGSDRLLSMEMIMRLWLPFAFLTGLAACSSPHAGAERIVLTGSTDVVKGCKFLQQASGDQNLIGGALAGMAREDAMRQLKNKAAEIGGTHIVTQSISTGWAGANAVGDVYRC